MRRILVFAAVFTVFSLALLTGSAANAAFPGDNGVIAFTRFTHGQNDIWVVRPDSTGTQRLTKTVRADESFPDWNAAGTRVVFSKCTRSEFGNCDIWVMDADGGNKTRLTNTPNAQETWPAWSPDGTQIAFTSNISDTFQDIWVMDANGSNSVRLTTTSAFDAFPEWSPDGSRIAFTSDRVAPDDIWLVDPDGSNPERLTTGTRSTSARTGRPTGRRSRSRATGGTSG